MIVARHATKQTLRQIVLAAADLFISRVLYVRISLGPPSGIGPLASDQWGPATPLSLSAYSLTTMITISNWHQSTEG